MISKNHRSVRIFVPVNRVREGPLKGIRGLWNTVLIFIFYLRRNRIESKSHESKSHESQDLNLNLVRTPGN